jgi:hypothetical protein
MNLPLAGATCMADNFLICRNCIRWGQPWLLGKKTILCEQKQDISGVAYSSLHPACKYFIPIQSALPEQLQRMRLLVQTLSQTQLSYFAWALAQASLLLPLKDADGQSISLGDQVMFRLGAYGHTGTVEGVDQHHKQAVVIHSPAFVNSNISLLASSLTKITREKAKELLGEYPDKSNDISWHIECLIQEITVLRAKKDSWTKKEYSAAVFYEQQLESLKKQVRQDALMASV